MAKEFEVYQHRIGSDGFGSIKGAAGYLVDTIKEEFKVSEIDLDTGIKTPYVIKVKVSFKRGKPDPSDTDEYFELENRRSRHNSRVPADDKVDLTNLWATEEK
jgi:hypothetical protein